MSYAINATNDGWRAINSQADLLPGETYSDTQPVLAVPDTIADLTPRQIRMALTRAGLRAQVESAIAAGDQDLKDWWNYSQTFERSHQEVQVMASALGQTVAQVDALWKLGATL